MRNQWELVCFAFVPAIAVVLAVDPPPRLSRAVHRDAFFVVDGRGKQVSVDTPFRGAALYSGIVMPDYLLVTERPATILDTFSFGDNRDQPTLLDKVFPSLRSIPTVAFQRASGIETMLLQRPGAVLTWNFTANQFDAMGLPAIGLRVAAEQDVLQRAAIYGALVQRPDRAEKLTQAFHAANEQLRRELNPDEIANKKRVLMLNQRQIGGVIVATNSHAPVWHRAGCVEAAKEINGDVDPESIMAIDPDILILSGVLTPETILQEPALRSLRAVREGRMYVLPRGIATFAWNIVDLPLYARWLSELAYPERLRLGLRSDMREAYSSLLSFTPSESDLDYALHIDVNGNSRGYDRFKKTSGDRRMLEPFQSSL